jgi:hypothetical protein
MYGALTLSGRPFQTVPLTPFSPSLHEQTPRMSPLAPPVHVCGPTTPDSPFGIVRFRLFRFRSPLLTESLICFLFLRVLRWFTSPGSLPHPYVFRMGYEVFALHGFPHSEIPGSRIACISPRLIAAGHVLLRLSSPRHPHACS